MKNTKSESYHSLTCSDLSNGQKAIMQAFKNTDTCYTRSQLINVTQKKINVICARVNELLTAKKLIVRGRVVDASTKKTVEVLGLPVAVQLELV